MNGPHDMGGFTAFGPVIPEPGGPAFHAAWERRAFALTLAMGMTGSWNIDASRHARERIPANVYWALSYYEIWIEGLTRLLAESGLATAREIETGTSLEPPRPVNRVAKAAMVPSILAKGSPASRSSHAGPLFAPGDKIRTRNDSPGGHTRLPRYARGRAGDIVRVHGAHVFPDSNAVGQGENPAWLYTVRFTAHELWGKSCKDTVCVDLWEPYLELG
jgi:nitrile hydratase